MKRYEDLSERVTRLEERVKLLGIIVGIILAGIFAVAISRAWG